MSEFTFPPLGDTDPARNPIVNEGEQGRMYWQSKSHPGFYVSLQQDVPAVAYRCHYTHELGFMCTGSSPCTWETAQAFIAFVEGRSKVEAPDA